MQQIEGINCFSYLFRKQTEYITRSLVLLAAATDPTETSAQFVFLSAA